MIAVGIFCLGAAMGVGLATMANQSFKRPDWGESTPDLIILGSALVFGAMSLYLKVWPASRGWRRGRAAPSRPRPSPFACNAPGQPQAKVYIVCSCVLGAYCVVLGTVAMIYGINHDPSAHTHATAESNWPVLLCTSSCAARPQRSGPPTAPPQRVHASLPSRLRRPARALDVPPRRFRPAGLFDGSTTTVGSPADWGALCACVVLLISGMRFQLRDKNATKTTPRRQRELRESLIIHRA